LINQTFSHHLAYFAYQKTGIFFQSYRHLSFSYHLYKEIITQCLSSTHTNSKLKIERKADKFTNQEIDKREYIRLDECDSNFVCQAENFGIVFEDRLSYF